MRAVGFAGLVLALLAINAGLWIATPERQLVRSAVLAGLVVGRTTAATAP